MTQGHVMDVSKKFPVDDGKTDLQLLAGIAGGTRIRTLDGVLPVEFLQPGDRIVTRSGAKRLVAVSVRQSRCLEVVRITASTLGHDRPGADLLIGPGQPVVVRDWRARALYGAEVAAVPSARLADGEFIRHETHALHLYTLRFAEDEVIWAEGVELACPAVIASQPARARTAGVGSRL
jgi:Hint domain